MGTQKKNVKHQKYFKLKKFITDHFLSAHKASLRADTTLPIVLGKVNYVGCRVIIYDNDYAIFETDKLTGCKTTPFGGNKRQSFLDKNNNGYKMRCSKKIGLPYDLKDDVKKIKSVDCECDIKTEEYGEESHSFTLKKGGSKDTTGWKMANVEMICRSNVSYFLHKD